MEGMTWQELLYIAALIPLAGAVALIILGFLIWWDIKRH